MYSTGRIHTLAPYGVEWRLHWQEEPSRSPQIITLMQCGIPGGTAEINAIIRDLEGVGMINSTIFPFN